MEIIIGILRQLMIALIIADIMWITLPIVTSKEIRNDLPLATKVILLILVVVVFFATEIL